MRAFIWLLVILAGGGIGLGRAAEMSHTVFPLSKVVLYSSGVGYFQHDGVVQGNTRVSLTFTIDQINDVLKSLTVQDLDGGQVGVATYAVRDPLSKTLQSFAVDLSDKPTLGQLLQQLRGARLEVVTPDVVQGTILGIEVRHERTPEGTLLETEYLALLTAEGLRTFALPQIQRFRLLDTRLETELRRALAALAARHDTRKRTVTLVFHGSGRRRVRVAYVMAVPVWKATYRLVLSPGKPLLQGWAIVENTTDADWQNVKLTLVSGRPISFVMDLYTPLYVERPKVVPELYTSLRPPTHEQALEALEKRGREARARPLGPGVRRQALTAPAAPETPRGVVPLAQAVRLGEVFAYTVAVPVTLSRQQSALIPIVQAPVEGERVSIYNQRVHPKYPLLGFRLRNTTGLYFMPGPVTVFDAGAYAGDARLADLPPAQERLISYALDLKVEVEAVTARKEQSVVAVRLRKGVLVATHKTIAEQIYRVRNRNREAKAVLIEHPLRAGWRLVAPPRVSERTRDVYRFALTVAPDETAELRVREEKPRQETVRLLDAAPDVIAYYVRVPELRPQVRQALEKAVALRRRLDDTRARRQRLEQRVQAIAKEQERIRQNMARLARNAALYQRYVGKLDAQETELEQLQQEIESLLLTEELQRRELQEYLLGLDLE